ncbi:MAG: aminodeoxychorismate/anthranilate synthase component II [Candidatus Omnitrophica bacterium]|nr:aminodeoxychorismate/anthranilate synthase component II [Candidatus Omnitrophota bacterium]MBU1046981.1 aminodeoxychorismate/anthranilate synthase component II [Candidatus Omnitrophota bacterium]MBU1631249.1 aminodeoxychorismate/anthranilate synthase component II [Candidatus Omnitrophota bacterium]MBU1766809.1 aminodeoxychorismate/anthranilate synthase component II [Candidatus Omnitrophota bacterium]MBU1889527.1 aminodeoxychorismate/anthranilate synthase component II [Candidatus Omnitrophota
MILVIDNYDSFVYNLVQYLGELGADLKVYRNDKITIRQIKELKPEKMVISPGPGRPENAGISCELIKTFAPKIPILGVCLGHQALGYTFKGKIIGAKELMHGKTSMIYHKNKGIFQNIPSPFEATRYHSLIVEKKSLPDCFKITAWTKKGKNIDEIMAMQHTQYPSFGVQFHPESILTQAGKLILKNFIDIK